MEIASGVFGRIAAILNSGIAGTQVTISKIALVLVLFALLVWATGRLTRWLADGVLPRRGVDLGVSHAIGAVLRYAVIAIGIVVILQGAGIDLTALTVLLGALGVGLGFGLQNVAGNFVSGLVILFERPIKVGDRVEVGGIEGNVREINARATTIVTNENIAIIVPNSQFISEQVTNWSYTTRLVRIQTTVGVSYGSDVQQVRQALLDVAECHPGVLASPEPEIMFLEFGESWLNFALRVWTQEYTSIPIILRSELNFMIWDKFKELGIEIPVSQHDLHIRSGVLEVRAQS